MMYVEFYVKDKQYKLRLNTRNIVALEKQIGCNPLAIFGVDGEQMPTISEMVTILNYALQQYHHGISMLDAYDIFDKWIEDGNTATDFISVILDIYKVSGIIKNDNNIEETDIEKN